MKERINNVTLCVDLMFVNGIVVLTSIDRSIRFRGLVPMKSKTKDEIYKAIDVILRHYNKAGFRIKTIHCDREFKPLMDDVSDEMDAEMNYTAKDGHTYLRLNGTTGPLVNVFELPITTCRTRRFPR